MKRPTIADIARRAGVSKGAVSYALNGRPGVSEETRARIHAIAQEIGWRPNLAARLLSGAGAGAIGLVVCRPARFLGVEPFFMELISGIEGELAARSYALMLQVAAGHEDEIAVYRRWWGEGRVDGVILVDLHTNDPRVPVMEKLGMPAVVIGHPSAAGSLPAVWSDEAAAMREVLEHLAALGHRRVARVAGPAALAHTAIRDAAFVESLAALGLEEAPAAHTDHTGEQGARATRRLLSSRSRPTAIVYDNDVTALAGLSVAQEMGLRVPAGLSVVAWDDSPLCQVVRPPLTTTARDIPASGARAAQLLLRMAAGEQVTGVEDAAARLRPRGSTAPPP
ncbi:LacI family DNA-binding transcriptional regulator [Nonomuraea roseoviolacea]|uniref:DNA-binding LacI/PurR family transcriptional regulator n=1 Tax=Nonomuraea roseoviolacea subsp. carminata TaxID=160689 RepID=A0ABT1KA14_9ACTN|nr:LacI family DNA-binding transcriptional regulator [Nonomuraea roseoviolacea]MCP2350851.1 DNA-binding LacI/PurR family transcriptional regulator [Nonomuraea roseoviolacea subsp. carminata]